MSAMKSTKTKSEPAKKAPEATETRPEAKVSKTV